MRRLREIYKKLEELFKRHKTAIKVPMIFLLMLGFIVCMLLSSYAETMNEDISERLIRLHVVANSDSKEDQALKREVRDRILQYIQPKYAKVVSRKEAIKILDSELTNINNIANSVISSWKKDYKAKSVIGVFPFPTKEYGDVALPAGSYEALRVQLGKGDGANWWCVMFPPLCFVDATHGTIPEDVKKKLKSTLSEDEYKLVATGDRPSVKYKFKIVELFQGSKNKIVGLVSGLFRHSS